MKATSFTTGAEGRRNNNRWRNKTLHFPKLLYFDSYKMFVSPWQATDCTRLRLLHLHHLHLRLRLLPLHICGGCRREEEAGAGRAEATLAESCGGGGGGRQRPTPHLPHLAAPARSRLLRPRRLLRPCQAGCCPSTWRLEPSSSFIDLLVSSRCVWERVTGCSC